MKKILENILAVVIIAAIIGFVVLGICYSDGMFEGTYMEELMPALILGVGVGMAVLLIVSNIFKCGGFVAGGIAFVIAVAYDLLNLNETVGMIALAVLGVIMIILLLVRWIKIATDS